MSQVEAGLDPSLFLIGFMGAGKSSVGPLLAEALNLPFIDLDEAIVGERGKTIAEIFRNEGEPAFREYERNVLKTLQLPAVVALGGGAFIQKEIRRYVRKQGISLYLDWPEPVLRARIADDPTRPLATDRSRLASLLEGRLPVYRQADLIWTSHSPHRESPREIVHATIPLIRRKWDQGRGSHG